MRHLLLSIILLIVPVGCNLMSRPSPEPTEITISITVNPAPTQETVSDDSPVVVDSEPVEVSNNASSSGQTIATDTTCATPLSRVTYTVQPGDTLFAIAQRTESSVAELSRMNCLDSADTIDVGQVLFVPQATAGTTSLERSIVYWVGSPTRINDQSIQIGCETYLNPVVTSIAETGDPATDIRVTMTALLNQEAQSPMRNLWESRGLTVNTVSVNNGVADIRLVGDMLLVGVCGDVDLLTALMLSILSNADVETIRVSANGVNMAQLFDMSGRSGADAVFSASNYAVPAGYR